MLLPADTEQQDTIITRPESCGPNIQNQGLNWYNNANKAATRIWSRSKFLSTQVNSLAHNWKTHDVTEATLSLTHQVDRDRVYEASRYKYSKNSCKNCKKFRKAHHFATLLSLPISQPPVTDGQRALGTKKGKTTMTFESFLGRHLKQFEFDKDSSHTIIIFTFKAA